MTFSELGIHRHVMAYMVSCAIMLFGLVGYFRVGIDEYPQVDFPTIIVATQYKGADAKVIDNVVTTVLLNNLNGITGIDTITGRSDAGRSTVILSFDLDKNIDIAFNEVQTKVNQALGSLPGDIEVPQIRKASNLDTPILAITFSGDRTIQNLNEYATEVVKKKLETINGVSEIQVDGEIDRVVRVELDIFKLASYNIGVNEVIMAFQKSHIQMPGGFITGNNKELLLNLDLEYHSVNEMKNIVIKKSGGALVKLSDVANVIDGSDDFRQYSSFNSTPAITLGVMNIAGSNSFSIEKDVMERLQTDIAPNLLPGIQFEITENKVDYIRAVVSSLEEHLYLGTFLTAIIVYLFLRSFISTMIISVSIPISLLGAMIVIYAFGYTLNTITLLGLLLLIGVVVDDSIIVLENIYRKIEEGMTPVKAAIEGSNQVLFAVLAATLSLVCIFGPVIFMAGIIGRFFQSFAVVVTFGVLISYFNSLYITPMLCARYLKSSHKKENAFKRFLESMFLAMERSYTSLLSLSLKHRTIVLILSLLIFFSSFPFFSRLGTEFTADGDKSAFSINIRTPAGSNIYYTLDKVKQVENILNKHKEVQAVVATVGNNASSVNRAKLDVNMVPIKSRDISQKDFSNKVQEELKNIAGANVHVISAAGVDGGAKLNFSITATDLDALYKTALLLEDAYQKDPRIGNADLTLELTSKINFVPNRDKMALLNVSSLDVAQAISVNVGGATIGKFNNANDSKRYDVRLKAKDNQFHSLADLNNIYVLSNIGSQLIRLDSIVTPKEELGFSRIYKNGSVYAATFSSNPNASLGEAITAIKEINQKILPPGYNLVFAGSSKELQKTISSVLFSFSLSIILLYMVLASQFNSFIQPLVLMMAIPLAIVGASISLFLTKNSLNIFSMIGFILLVGLVAKNSILLIDFTNELRQKGKSINEALLLACPLRLRPIIMTSLTVILSMLPAALAKGEGSENNASMSVAVIGGMISSTLLTLLVIPALYSAVESIFEKIENRKSKNIENINELNHERMINELNHERMINELNHERM